MTVHAQDELDALAEQVRELGCTLIVLAHEIRKGGGGLHAHAIYAPMFVVAADLTAMGNSILKEER